MQKNPFLFINDKLNDTVKLTFMLYFVERWKIERIFSVSRNIKNHNNQVFSRILSIAINLCRHKELLEKLIMM